MTTLLKSTSTVKYKIRELISNVLVNYILEDIRMLLDYFISNGSKMSILLVAIVETSLNLFSMLNPHRFDS